MDIADDAPPEVPDPDVRLERSDLAKHVERVETMPCPLEFRPLLAYVVAAARAHSGFDLPSPILRRQHHQRYVPTRDELAVRGMWNSLQSVLKHIQKKCGLAGLYVPELFDKCEVRSVGLHELGAAYCSDAPPQADCEALYDRYRQAFATFKRDAQRGDFYAMRFVDCLMLGHDLYIATRDDSRVQPYYSETGRR